MSEQGSHVHIYNPNPPPEGTPVTSRGFAMYADFLDYYGSRIRVQQSSLATEDCVWIFCDKEDMSPHLTRDMAKQMILALAEFVGST